MQMLPAFASVVEVATGLALLLVPSVMVDLLLGMSAGDDATALARFLGIALLALGVSWWPTASSRSPSAPRRWGMLLYNGLVAMFLAALSMVHHMTGALLWPAVVLHAAIAIVMLWQMNRASHPQEN